MEKTITDVGFNAMCYSALPDVVANTNTPVPVDHPVSTFKQNGTFQSFRV
jgi:hypothetical protein